MSWNKNATRWLLTLGLLVGSILAVVAAPLLSAALMERPYHGRALDRAAPPLKLEDVGGTQFSLAALGDRHVYVMFGYLRCPDICHPQVALMRALRERIGTERAAFVFIDIDPAFDQPGRLSAYFGDDSGIYVLRPPDRRTAQNVANAFDEHVFTDREALSHPGRIYLIDPRRRIRLAYAPGTAGLIEILEDWKLLTASA